MGSKLLCYSLSLVLSLTVVVVYENLDAFSELSRSCVINHLLLLLDARLFAHLVSLNDVFELEVVEAAETDSTLKVSLDFGCVIFETL